MCTSILALFNKTPSSSHTQPFSRLTDPYWMHTDFNKQSTKIHWKLRRTGGLAVTVAINTGTYKQNIYINMMNYTCTWMWTYIYIYIYIHVFSFYCIFMYILVDSCSILFLPFRWSCCPYIILLCMIALSFDDELELDPRWILPKIAKKMQEKQGYASSCWACLASVASELRIMCNKSDTSLMSFKKLCRTGCSCTMRFRMPFKWWYTTRP